MTLTVLDVAGICSGQIYDDSTKWDLLIAGEPYIGVRIDHARKVVIVACRGSTTLLDFLHDGEAGILCDAGPLGTVALGFYDGIVSSYLQIEAFVRLLLTVGRYRLIVGGHSLGAAHAALWAAHAVLQGTQVDAYVLMGCPAPGCGELRAQLLKVPKRYSFRNGYDPVYSVPPWCSHPSDPILLHEPPSELPAGASYGLGPLVDWHQWVLYLKGIEKISLPVL